jgi:hypothetical protein
MLPNARCGQCQLILKRKIVGATEKGAVVDGNVNNDEIAKGQAKLRLSAACRRSGNWVR